MKRIEKLKVLALALLMVLGGLAHHSGALAGQDRGDGYRTATFVSEPEEKAPIAEVHKLYRAACERDAGVLGLWGDVAAFFDI